MCYKVHPKTFWKPHNLREHFRDAQRGWIILLLSSSLPKNNPIIVGIYFMILRWSNCLSLSPVQTIGVGIHPRCWIFQVFIFKNILFFFKNILFWWTCPFVQSIFRSCLRSSKSWWNPKLKILLHSCQQICKDKVHHQSPYFSPIFRCASKISKWTFYHSCHARGIFKSENNLGLNWNWMHSMVIRTRQSFVSTWHSNFWNWMYSMVID